MNGRDLFLLLTQGIIIYFLFSTLFFDASIIGSFGYSVGGFSRDSFGLLAFVLYGSAIYAGYRFYQDRTFSARRQEILVSSVLLFFTLLIFQGLVISSPWGGAFGHSFIGFLQPFIGLFGVWIFWIVSTLVSVIILRDLTLSEMVYMLRNKTLTRDKPIVITPDEPKILEKNEEVFTLDSIDEETSVDETKEDDVSLSLGKKLENILPDDEIDMFEIKKVSPLPDETTQAKSEPTDDSIFDSMAQDIDDRNQQIQDEAFVEEVNEIMVEQTPQISAVTLPEPVVEHHAVIVNELEENTKLLDDLTKGVKQKVSSGFALPSLDILHKPSHNTHHQNEGHLDQKIKNLIEKLAKFKIDGDVVRTYTGPVVSTFEFKPAAHIKVSKILTLQDDLAMALKAQTIRIQAPIPGKDVVGIEIPNEEIETIYLREILESDVFKNSTSELTIVLGEDIVGKPFVTDLKKLPHLLIAGTTGSGKSVGINAMILSLLYRNPPEQLRILMIDPKMLEFSIYNEIPHLLTPVITQAKQAIVALNNMVTEMERRYKLMSENRTKNIDNYNEKMRKKGKDTLPFIVIVIDELADLMMTSGKEVEFSVGRLAQMARASGIHLIVATQRPSVDVVTGLIKANLPSRISYRVGQKIDSKVILDAMGAESLLGRGDMLFTPPGMTGLVRLHAPWSSEDEIENIVEFLKDQAPADYDQRFLVAPEGSSEGDIVVAGDLDPLFEDAKAVVLGDRKTSISYLQRKLQIGYNRSANIIEQLEAMGVLSEPNAKGNREII